jgi:hypothetical protein
MAAVANTCPVGDVTARLSFADQRRWPAQSSYEGLKPPAGTPPSRGMCDPGQGSDARSPNVHLVAVILDAYSPVVPGTMRDGPASTQGGVSMRLDRVTSRIGVILVTGGLFVALTGGAALAAQGSPNGAAFQRPVFYEGEQVTVNMFEVPASETLLEDNAAVNTIYASNDLDDEQDFLSVIDAIQGEGFNPLWHQVLIVFNQGFTPHQFVSEDEVLAAAAGANPEITLVSTDEVYRCSIVGSK